VSAEPERQHYGITLLVLTTAALAYALSQTMVAPAIPAMQESLGASTTAITFVLTAYLLSASVATPIVGRLGDMFGKERVLVITLITFGVGSFVCAISHSIELLIVGRVIQGVAGAIFPLSFGIIRDEFPPERVGTGIGLISSTFGIGGGAGLVLSGLIVDHLSYEWMFWLTLPVVAFSVVMAHFFVPESPVRVKAKIDWVGAAVLSLGLICVLVAVGDGNDWGWLSPEVIGLIVFGLGVLAFWTRFEARHPAPLVDMAMMKARGVWTTNLAGFFLGFGMFGSFILIPQFVQVDSASGYGFGATVTEAGLYLLPSTAVMLFAGPIAGWLGDRVGSKLPMAIGTATASLAFVMLSLEHDHPWAIYVASAFFGLGIGFSFAAVANLIVAAVDRTQTGIATGMNTIMRTVGGAIGGQIAAAIVAAEVIAGGYPADSGFTAAFMVSAIGVAFAFAATLLIPGQLISRRAKQAPLQPPAGVPARG
jgi:EmrB/QacA subfamily drug resistance transporter